MSFIESLSRRNMMAGLATSAAFVASTSGDAKPAKARAVKQSTRSLPPIRSVGSLATASVDDWAQHVGTTFETSTGHRLRLTDVRAFSNQNKRPAGLRARPFAATFDIVAGKGDLPKQLTLRVNHKAGGGTFDMFVSAGNPDLPLRRTAVFS
jgi:hypothetical protein